MSGRAPLSCPDGACWLRYEPSQPRHQPVVAAQGRDLQAPGHLLKHPGQGRVLGQPDVPFIAVMDALGDESHGIRKFVRHRY